ncbi:hypothetical protein ACS0TY_011699 [Phlomoides rotata]
MVTLSAELCNIFGDDFDEHSLGEDDNPSNVFEIGANEAQSPSNVFETGANEAQCPKSNHTENEANDIVPEHARLKGFSVVKRTSKRAVERDDYKYARMICDKSGSSRANKTSKRVGCTARLNAIRQDNGNWIILKMVTEHNHEIDPTFSPLMPAHRQLNVHMKRQLEANDIAGGYPHMTEEYKKFQEVEKYFQQCIELAMCSSEKLEFIKEKCNEMKDALVNWVPTTSDNVPPSQTTQNTEDFDGTPILNPIVTATRGRPRSSRYISRAKEHSRGRGRRAHGRVVGRSRVQGRVGGRGSDGHGDGMATQGNEGAGDGTQENEGAFIFDLNEDADFSAKFQSKLFSNLFVNKQ